MREGSQRGDDPWRAHRFHQGIQRSNRGTVARSYELLTQRGVIRNQRGIGYFITEDATATIKDIERKRFVEEELPVFIRRADLLGIDLKDYIK